MSSSTALEPALALDLHTIEARFREKTEIFDTAWMRDQISLSGRSVIDKPDAPALGKLIEYALRNKIPYSIIRLGDGDANLLYYGTPKSDTPTLDFFAANAIVRMQEDSFEPTHANLTYIRDELNLAISTSDVVVTLGLWRGRVFDINNTINKLWLAPRGQSGYMRGHDLTLELSHRLPTSTTFASTQLYAAVIMALPQLIQTASRVVCITGREGAVMALRRRFPSVEIDHLKVGHQPGQVHSTPTFLNTIREKFMNISPGSLYLIGSGPWAELYCHQVKLGGGVGVDIGSGFDLLDGRNTRPVHSVISELLKPSLPTYTI